MRSENRIVDVWYINIISTRGSKGIKRFGLRRMRVLRRVIMGICETYLMMFQNDVIDSAFLDIGQMILGTEGAFYKVAAVFGTVFRKMDLTKFNTELDDTNVFGSGVIFKISLLLFYYSKSTKILEVDN